MENRLSLKDYIYAVASNLQVVEYENDYVATHDDNVIESIMIDTERELSLFENN